MCSSDLWYCHSSIFYNVMQRLANAASGNAATNISSEFGPVFLGYPVVFAQAMPSGAPTTNLAGQFICHFGDLGKAATMGIKRGVTIAIDNSYGFNTDNVFFRATERFDINCHERGTASTGGPVIGIRCNPA